MNQTRFTLLINAGGTSRRMGRPKALLPAPGSGEPLVRHIARRLMPLAAEMILIANDPAVAAAVEPLAARWLTDAHPDCGPLGGLATGLAVCEGWSICVACDLPFVRPELFLHFAGLTTDSWDAIVPCISGRDEPLHALYHPRCLAAIESALQTGRRRMDTFFPDVRVRRIDEDELRGLDPDLRSFVNINTPQEWAAAQRNL